MIRRLKSLTTRAIGFSSSLIVIGVMACSGSIAGATPSPQTVYRLDNQASGQHLLTIDSNENSTLLGNPVWHAETSTFSALLTAGGSCASGTEVVHRLYNSASGEHLLTADNNEATWLTANPTYSHWYTEGIAFCAYSTQVAGTKPVYRLFNSQSGEHLLTADSNEVSSLTANQSTNHWYLEGTAFYAN